MNAQRDLVKPPLVELIKRNEKHNEINSVKREQFRFHPVRFYLALRISDLVRDILRNLHTT